MKKFIVALAACLAAMQSVSAVLPPLYNSRDEIIAVLSSDELGKYFQSGEMIVRIRKTPGGYEITTNQRRVLADVTPEPSSRPGPSQFRVKFRKSGQIGGSPGYAPGSSLGSPA